MPIYTYRTAAALLDYINDWPDRPAQARLGSYGEGLPALRLLPSSGAQVLKRYADGTVILSLPFTVSLRARGGSPIASLDALAGYIQKTGPPYLGEGLCALAVELCEQPQRTGSDVSGLAEYSLPRSLKNALSPRFE